MPDGRFVYRVETTKIVDDQDLSVLDAVGYKRLMLSACHPLYSAAQRIIAFASQMRREPPRVKRSDVTAARRRSSTEDWSRDSKNRIRPIDKGERDGHDREPVEDLEQHGGAAATVQRRHG